MSDKSVEFLQYVAASAGMALAISCYSIIGNLFSLGSAPLLLAGILAAFLICLVVTLATAELAGMFPAAPGIRTYFKHAFNQETSLFLLFLYLSLVILMANAECYAASEIFKILDIDLPREWVCVLFIGLIAAINLAGIEVSLRVQLWSVSFLIAATLAISCYALVFAEAAAPGAVAAAAPGGAGNLLTALPLLAVTSIFLFVGFEWVTPAGKSEAAYKKLIPLAMPTALVCLALVYILFAFAVEKVVPRGDLRQAVAPQLLLGAALWGKPGVILLAALSFLAMLTSFNIGVLGASRLIYSTAREGHLPAVLRLVSLGTMVPYCAVIAIALASVLGAIFTAKYQLQLDMAHAAVITTCVIYAMMVLAAIRLRKSAFTRHFGYRLPVTVFYAVFPLFAALAAALFIDRAGSATPLILTVTASTALALCFYRPLLNLFATATGKT